jgi:putative ABC transport system ATP-binding protein
MSELQTRTEEKTTNGTAQAVRLRGVQKTFTKGTETISVLNGVELDIPAGSFEALMGPSGSGKSTLLNLIAGIDRPTQGDVVVAGQNLSKMNNKELAHFRSQNLGFVFQAYNLIPVLTALENVMLPLILRKLSRSERATRAQTALRVVGLEDRMNHFPRQLSGGQEQRVAIARAIVNDPQIILADEPTGDLDRERADEILNLLEKLNKEFGKSILMVTHDPAAAERAGIIRRLDKGRLL